MVPDARKPNRVALALRTVVASLRQVVSTVIAVWQRHIMEGGERDI